MQGKRSEAARRCVVATLVTLGLLCANGARAQEPGNTGIVMGYPASVGVIWHASTNLAVRPEISFSTVSGHSVGTGSSVGADSDGWSVAVGVSGLFYFGKWDNLRSYVSPRFTYGRSTNDSMYSDLAPIISSKNTVYAFTGSFGAEYMLGTRFAVFGEAGFGYTHQHNTYRSGASASFQSESTNNSWGTRTAVGAIFYF